MMKKLLLPLMLMLATIAVVPGNSNKTIKASAEETKSDVTNKTKNVEKGYREKIGYNPDFYVVEIGDGPRTL